MLENKSEYDYIIVDSPSTGHILSLLDAPWSLQNFISTGLVSKQTKWMREILEDKNSCGVLVPIYNTSKYADRPGSNASGFYPIGSYKFYYVAEVGCDHEIKCEITVNVRPAIPPTPYCLDGVVIALMPIDNNLDGQADEGMVEVWASDLDKGSYHSCGNIPLTFSFSKDINDRSRVFTCDDLGVNEVEIWVTDTAGNQNLCHTHIDIQNNTL